MEQRRGLNSLSVRNKNGHWQTTPRPKTATNKPPSAQHKECTAQQCHHVEHRTPFWKTQTPFWKTQTLGGASWLLFHPKSLHASSLHNLLSLTIHTCVQVCVCVYSRQTWCFGLCVCKFLFKKVDCFWIPTKTCFLSVIKCTHLQVQQKCPLKSNILVCCFFLFFSAFCFHFLFWLCVHDLF